MVCGIWSSTRHPYCFFILLLGNTLADKGYLNSRGIARWNIPFVDAGKRPPLRTISGLHYAKKELSGGNAYPREMTGELASSTMAQSAFKRARDSPVEHNIALIHHVMLVQAF